MERKHKFQTQNLFTLLEEGSGYFEQKTTNSRGLRGGPNSTMDNIINSHPAASGLILGFDIGISKKKKFSLDVVMRLIEGVLLSNSEQLTSLNMLIKHIQ